jgi:hypothetical protein
MGTRKTRVVKGLKPTMPGWRTLSLMRPKVRFTPTWSCITVAQLLQAKIKDAAANRLLIFDGIMLQKSVGF